jgi:hypothetical protein
MKYAKPEIREVFAAVDQIAGVHKGGPMHYDVVDPCLPPLTISAYEADE